MIPIMLPEAHNPTTSQHKPTTTKPTSSFEIENNPNKRKKGNERSTRVRRDARIFDAEAKVIFDCRKYISGERIDGALELQQQWSGRRRVDLATDALATSSWEATEEQDGDGDGDGPSRAHFEVSDQRTLPTRKSKGDEEEEKGRDGDKMGGGDYKRGVLRDGSGGDDCFQR